MNSEYDPFEDSQEGLFECERCQLIYHADYASHDNGRTICQDCMLGANERELEIKRTGIKLEIALDDPYFPANLRSSLNSVTIGDHTYYIQPLDEILREEVSRPEELGMSFSITLTAEGCLPSLTTYGYARKGRLLFKTRFSLLARFLLWRRHRRGLGFISEYIDGLYHIYEIIIEESEIPIDHFKGP